MDRKTHPRLNLFTPGPVNLSRAASEALILPSIHHRTQEFEAIYSSFREDLKKAFLCSGEVAVLTTSGTGGMEAAVSSLLNPNSRSLIPVSGKFSERWVEICKVYGIEPVILDLAPGSSPRPEEIERNLRKHRISSILLTHCETSTSALTDLKGIGEIVQHWSEAHGQEITLIADCISTLCVDELRMDEWNLDCCISCSQKGLLSPPGLAFVALGPRAIDLLKRSRTGVYYLNLRNYVGGTYYPFTPAVNVIRAARASLEEILSIGLEMLWMHYHGIALALRELLTGAGFQALADEQASAVVAFWSGGVDPMNLASLLEEHHGILIAQGQGDLRGKIFRISPIGKSRAELESLGVALAEILERFGMKIEEDAMERYRNAVAKEIVKW